ncbi:MAG: TonB-dependent receptor [Pseudomonadota bacterium]
MVYRPAARRSAFRASLFLATALLQLPVAAYAQTSDEQGFAEGDIVVTALKRETSLQNTPISISAVTGETLTKSGVTDIGGLNAPSLNFVDGGPSNRRVVIRGIQAAGEPTVGVYYDEAPVTGVVGSTSDAGGNTPEIRLFDVSRVEVLRGPQGTLYGSGSMGGTLRIIYNKPSFEVEGAADLTLSDTNDGGFNYTGNVMANLPIVADQLALRLSGFYSRDAGFIDNIALGIDNINKTKIYGGRAQLRAVPTETLTIDLAAFVNRTRTDTNAWTATAGKNNADSLTRQPLRDNFNLFSGTAAWDVGFATLTGIVSYQTRSLDQGSDVTRFIQSNRTPGRCAAVANAGAACDTTALTNYYAFVDDQLPSALYPEQDMNTLTSELRLGSDGSGPINWTIGGFYSRRHVDVANRQVHALPNGTLLIDGPDITVRNIDDRLKQLAAFGELSWDITDQFNLTGGARYFDYKRVIVGDTPIGNPLVGAAVRPLSRVASKENGTILKFNASYKVTPRFMLYAEASQGFRPGGINQTIGLDPSLAPYRSDSLWNYEVGFKSTLFDRMLTLNADIYQIDWKDIQITGRTANGAFSFITNAGSARVRGVEAEATLRPMIGLSITANGTYTDAVLTTNQSTTAVSAPGLEGDRIPYVPKWSGAIAAEYRWAVGNDLTALARADVRHTGSSLSDFRPNGTFTRAIDDYQLVNTRAGVESDDGKWGAYVFVNNLFNDTAIVRATSSAILAGRTIVTNAQPRTIGVNLQTKF